MKLISIVLVLLIIFTFTIIKYYQNIFFRVIGKVSFVVFFSSSIFFVLFPNIIQDLAEALGVGRGSDLLLYLLTVSTIALAGITINKVRAIEEKFTALVRNLALDDALKKRTDKNDFN